MRTVRTVSPRPNSFDLAAEYVGGESKERCPRKHPDGVAEEKLSPRHVIGSSQDAGNAAQHRDKAADGDDLAAVAQEQVLAELDAAFGDPQVEARTTALQDRRTLE